MLFREKNAPEVLLCKLWRMDRITGGVKISNTSSLGLSLPYNICVWFFFLIKVKWMDVAVTRFVHIQLAKSLWTEKLVRNM